MNRLFQGYNSISRTRIYSSILLYLYLATAVYVPVLLKAAYCVPDIIQLCTGGPRPTRRRLSPIGIQNLYKVIVESSTGV